MSLYPTTIRDLTGNPAIEAMELADVGGGFGLPDDPNAEMEAAFGYGTETDELTEREIDALYVEEMERRDAAAREVFGGDDDEPTPTSPASAAVRLETPEYWQAVAALKTDDRIIASIGAADDDPHTMNLTPAQQRAFLAGFTSELLRRMDAAARRAA